MASMAVKPTLAHGLQKCVGNLWEGGHFSDFTVVVEDTSFFCHRNILSACSGFFQGLFRSQMKESLDGRAKLTISKETFEIIINSIYKGTDGLTEATVLDVWSATHLLQIHYLTEECEQFVIHSLSVDNCFRSLNHAIVYSAQEVIDSCLDFISKNFEHVRNTESFLQLPYDYFYKVIESDILVTSSEDSVVDAISTWMEYKPDPEHCSRLYTGPLDEKTQNVSECCENRVELTSHIMTLGGNKRICSKNSACQADSTKEGDRKQHFVILISACRLFLANSRCLVNLLENQRDVIKCTGTAALLVNAVLYSSCVDRRQDGWPWAAVHRASSSYKHVMVFVSGDQVKAYSLDTGNVYEFAKVPADCRIFHKIILFNNDLYCVYQSNYKRPIISKLTCFKSWDRVTCMNMSYSQMLLAHGDYVYDVLIEYRRLTLSLWSHSQLHRKWMTQKCAGYANINSIIGFQVYVVVFIIQNRVLTAHCFNIETKKVHVCTTSMNATSQSMIGFSNNEDVYVLEGNGSLWKVYSTDTTPVGFELVSKLWDFNCTLKGCVLYRKKLYIFHTSMVLKGSYKTLLTSLPGICDDIEMIKINSQSQCLPMVLRGSWLTS